MKVSVVTICYNARDFIEPTILSVLSQTYENIEYIIIDGGSADGTVEIIKKYSDRLAHWVSEPDKGIYDAMNKGIMAATGEYIIFMNAGDKFADENVVKGILPSLDGSVVVTGRWNRRYSNGASRIGEPEKIGKLKVDMPLCHQATFIKTSYHKDHLFDTSYKYSADYDFFYKAWRSGHVFSLVGNVVADFIADHGASSDNVSASILERQCAWKNEKNLFFRKIHLRYQICRIRLVKMVKRMIK